MEQNKLEKYLLGVGYKFFNGKELKHFVKRVNEGKLLRSENPLSHLCSMFLTFDPKTKRILVVNHKKAKSWIFPGGHIEKGEHPAEAALREAKEELGLKKKILKLSDLFGIQILDIDDPPQICREHFDIFYALFAIEEDVVVDPKEFLGYEILFKSLGEVPFA